MLVCAAAIFLEDLLAAKPLATWRMKPLVFVYAATRNQENRLASRFRVSTAVPHSKAPDNSAGAAVAAVLCSCYCHSVRL